jgi:hypothetical protein
MLYVLFFLAGMLGGGTLFAPIFAYVGNWFPKPPAWRSALPPPGRRWGRAACLSWRPI